MRTFFQKPNSPKTPERSVPRFNLQRAIGKPAAPAISQTAKNGTEPGIAATNSYSFAHDFSRIPLHSPVSSALSPQIAVNQPGDKNEEEADRVADQVMRAPAPQFQRIRLLGDGRGNGQRGQPDREHDSVPATRAEAGDNLQRAAPSIVHEVLRSPGRPLDPGTRAFMEPRFGYDFSRVRVHNDVAAAQSAREVDADAYTVGHHVVFADGLFAPGTHQGNRLLAHELTHVTQQSEGIDCLQRSPKDDQRERDEKRQRRSESTARQRGRALAAKIRKEAKLSDKSVSQMARDLDFFEGAAREIYITTLRPTVQAVTAKVPLETTVLGLAGLASTFSQTFLPALQGGREIALGGRLQEPPGPEVLKARTEFRTRHSGHSDDVLNKIDYSLERVTKGNPALLIAFYRHYATHELTNKLPWNMDDDEFTGSTMHGDSDINPLVLRWESEFPTDDPESLLGETLIHEYSHTPQDNPLDDNLEAKAYGIEWFFAERSGDGRRAGFIVKRYSRERRKVKENMYFSYYTMGQLYKEIDKGGPGAEEARNMSVEFISKNASDYRPRLRDIFSYASSFYVP